MLLTAHYPLNLETALGGLMTRGSLPETAGVWIRIAGGCFLVDIWIYEYSTMLAGIIGAAGIIAIVISFFGDFSRVR